MLTTEALFHEFKVATKLEPQNSISRKWQVSHDKTFEKACAGLPKRTDASITTRFMTEGPSLVKIRLRASSSDTKKI